MNNLTTKGSNVNKLAQTLKRCGIATSVTDAHKIAGDITVTEKKVQSFFTEKKNEIHNDFLKNVHPNRPEFHNNHIGQTLIRQNAINQSQNNKTQVKTDFKTDAVKSMIDRAKNPRPLNIQIEFETPNYISAMQAQSMPEIKPLTNEIKVETHEVEIKPIEVKIEPKVETVAPIVKEEIKQEVAIEVKEEVIQKEDLTGPFTDQDYISKFIKNDKEEISAVEKEEIKPKVQEFTNKEVKIEERKIETKPQVKVDLGNYFGAKKTEEKSVVSQNVETPKTQTESPVQSAQSVTKPQAPAVDIHNFFNFAKKGKV